MLKICYIEFTITISCLNEVKENVLVLASDKSTALLLLSYVTVIQLCMYAIIQAQNLHHLFCVTLAILLSHVFRSPRLVNPLARMRREGYSS